MGRLLLTRRTLMAESADPPARERRDSKVETRKVDSNDNVTDFNEYHLVRRLGAGAFAHVDLCEIRHPRPSFFAPAPPPDQFAVKIFNKSILRKKRKYVSDASGKMHFTTELDKTAEVTTGRELGSSAGAMCEPNSGRYRWP